MSLFDMIGSVLIGPLKLLFEVIFSVAYSIIAHPGPAIIVLSLVMNILVLPLYKRADAIQIAARDTENKLKDVVTHIKKTFSGDERMMILQTYYRQNNYNPLSVLSGSISLLLEIPFFMAAYQFLSSVEAFKGVSFGPITDLSSPDGLLSIGNVSINLLPIIMTLVNVISSSLYLKGFPLKTKIQLYGMALFFLVFLYNSPAALVFYWTLNNAFSLVKTLFYQIKNSKIILKIMLSILGVISFALGIYLVGFWRSSFLICVGVAAQLPWLLPLLRKKLPFLKSKNQPSAQPNTALFICGALFLTVLVGLLIPSTYISASTQEYISSNYFYNPIWYIVYTLCLSAGTFMVWMGVFYWLSNPSGKVIFSRLIWIICGVTLVNYMFFGTNLGILSPDLLYTDGFEFAFKEHIINIAVILILFALLYLIAKKFSRGLIAILLTGTIALSSMSIINLTKIAKTAEETKIQLSNTSAELPSFSMSKVGKNVVVIMLDRAVGPFVPYIMEENPTLLKQFDGFTNYSNTLSYGAFTNFGTPALHGGYEYTPAEMNLRNTELLAAKHNEALKVMPTMFAREDYAVTLIDPSYAGYQWIPNVNIFKDIEGVSAYNADGRFNGADEHMSTIKARMRNFFLFSIMKTMPVSLQSPLYNNGAYRAVQSGSEQSAMPTFMNAYNVLKNMDTMTNITTSTENTFMFLRSNVTHEPVLLQEPSFTPSNTVNNSAYYSQEGKTITAGDSSYLLDNENAISHYHVNMVALMQLGEWFDYLRENGVYDNTRIIIASDHGARLGVFDDDYSSMHNIELYMPVLLVKDFDAHGFTISDEFMTNADVPSLAVKDLIESPTNPFTGKAIDSSLKTDNKNQYVILSNDWDITKNNSYQFSSSEWASVTGTVGDKDNWTFYSDAAPSTLPPDYNN